MKWRVWAPLALACACQRKQAATEPIAQPVTSSVPPVRERNLCSRPSRLSASVAPLGLCHADLDDPLTAARKFYDRQEYSEALSCAAKWTALMPDDPQGHSERAAALVALGNLEAAQLAYSRALALAPDQLDALLGAAHLYAVRLPSNRERDELAVLYSEKGLSLAKREGDQKLVEQFALLSAMSFNDLGDSQRAYERAEEALQLGPDNTDARYERGLALFELCRFGEATLAFRSLLADPEHRARAHHQLGLLRERNGQFREAERHFAQARQLSAVPRYFQGGGGQGRAGAPPRHAARSRWGAGNGRRAPLRCGPPEQRPSALPRHPGLVPWPAPGGRLSPGVG